MATFPQVVVMAVTFLALAILAVVEEAQAKPSYMALVTGCHIDSNLDEICQKCAKATKSTMVYPMCCSNEEGVHVWCKKYLEYGIH